MKIREGLVSNSSCTSFCIFGTILGENCEKELQSKFGENESLYDIVYRMSSEKKFDLELHSPPSGEYYLGRS